MHKLGVIKAIHVIDDFLFLATSRAKCLADMQAFIKMCGDLGVPLATGKTVGPSNALQFLGITLDAVSMEARLPEDKLTQCRLLLRLFLSRHKVTLRQLQSLIRVLNFCCSVIGPGRAFLRRLIDLTLGVSRPHYHIRLTRQVKLDLLTWQDFLTGFNGKAFFVDDKFLTGDYLQLFTDASGGLAMGRYVAQSSFLVDGPVPGIPLTSQYLNYIRSWRLWRRGVFLGLTVVCLSLRIMRP